MLRYVILLFILFFISIDIRAQTAEEYEKAGEQKYAEGAYEEAVAFFDKAIKINPNNGNTYYYRALSLNATGHYDEAIQDYTKVIEMKPENIADIYHNRGTSYKNFTKYTEAIRDFDMAIALNINNSLTYYYRGICLDNIGRYEEALQDFNKAIEMTPRKADYYYNRGNTLNHLRKYKEAVSDFKTALAIDPNLDEAKNGLRNAQQKLSKRNR